MFFFLIADLRILTESVTEAIAGLLAMEADVSLHTIFAQYEAVDFNYLLYSCENEERANSEGQSGCYWIPNHGGLVYAGLGGVVPLLEHVRRTSELGHPLCEHIRQGDWLLDFLIKRLYRRPKLHAFRVWLDNYFQQVRLIGYLKQPLTQTGESTPAQCDPTLL